MYIDTELSFHHSKNDLRNESKRRRRYQQSFLQRLLVTVLLLILFRVYFTEANRSFFMSSKRFKDTRCVASTAYHSLSISSFIKFHTYIVISRETEAWINICHKFFRFLQVLLLFLHLEFTNNRGNYLCHLFSDIYVIPVEITRLSIRTIILKLISEAINQSCMYA